MQGSLEFSWYAPIKLSYIVQHANISESSMNSGIEVWFQYSFTNF